MSTTPSQTTDRLDYLRWRPRRLRHTPGLRALVRETELRPSDFIYPLFVVPGRDVAEEVPSMPGVRRFSVDRLPGAAEAAARRGIPAVILFGVPERKDAVGSAGAASDGIVQQASRAIKATVPELLVIGDVCLCEYTDHGHCGVVHRGNGRLPDGHLLNDATLPHLGEVALSYAAAGVDVVAPSAMVDGMVGYIRSTLDQGGWTHLPILSYAVKYASAFYGPFRDAAEGAPRFGDRRSHQMDPANGREALREAALDAAEGADFLMVKPALAYLDIIAAVKAAQPALPLVAYNVSGEYAMIKAAAARGWLDERRVVLETLTGIKRAGADLIISYHALDAASWLTA